ncbi:amidohydrolase [Kitasatospora sp. NPDC006697]|uniref:amidohydrolase n=1 Tax=Kitasatospora sp. NPDC006697 TaxID=3364020 RepID=UPI0036B6EB5A
MEHQLARRTVLAGMAAATATAALTFATPAEASATADLVLHNGYVWTVDGRDSIQKAVAIRAGRIIYVGTDSGAFPYVGTGTEVVDLGGRMLMPGLHDGHLHSLTGGSSLVGLNVRYESLTVPRFLEIISDYLARTASAEPDGWATGQNWYLQAMQPAGVRVTRKDLDQLTTRRPIAITSSDYHTTVVNSRALALAGVTRDTPDPPGGVIEHDALGEPTGVLQDAAGERVTGLIPPTTDAENTRYAKAALAALAAQGGTTFMEAGAGEETLRVYTALATQGALTARAHIALLVGLDDRDPLPRLKQLRATYDTEIAKPRADVHVHNIKVFLDGVLQSPAQTAAVLEPYLVDDGHGHMVPGTHTGRVYWPEDQLTTFLVAAAAARFDPHAHAIGDRAVRVALNAYEAIRRAGHRSARPTVAHAELVSPADLPRFQRLGVVASMGFHWAKPGPDSTDSVEPHLGPERLVNYEPEGAILRDGGTISLGSDWPVDPLNHWEALRVVISRTAATGSPYAKYGVMTPSQRLLRRAAIRAATMNAAFQLRQDHETGSVEVGKLADLIVLDRNILKVPAQDIGNTNVLLTLVGGTPVHGSYSVLA